MMLERHAKMHVGGRGDAGAQSSSLLMHPIFSLKQETRPPAGSKGESQEREDLWENLVSISAQDLTPTCHLKCDTELSGT